MASCLPDNAEFASPFHLRPEGLMVTVRLAPKASRNAVAGIDATESGDFCLKVMVTAVPEDGKANAALCKLLAKTWKLTPGRLQVASGATSRRKQLLITEGDSDLKVRLDQWLAEFLAARR